MRNGGYLYILRERGNGKEKKRKDSKIFNDYKYETECVSKELKKMKRNRNETE